MSLPQVSFSSNTGRQQLLHHLRFNIEYLRRASLIDKQGRPFDLFAMAAHLYVCIIFFTATNFPDERL